MSGGDWKEMFNAACDGDLELVQYHVEAGVDIDYPHPEFLSTPLVASILARREAVALYLLEQGANPGQYSEFDGVTPMQAALSAGLPAVAAKLRALGASEPDRVPATKNWFDRLFGKRAV